MVINDNDCNRVTYYVLSFMMFKNSFLQSNILNNLECFFIFSFVYYNNINF